MYYKGSKMGNLDLNSGCIQSYEVSIVTEQHEDIKTGVVMVTIDTDIGTTKYRIAIDDRHPDINQITASFKAGLATAQSSEENFKINENSDRNYVIVNFPDGTFGQYTGARV
jgi:hypothetical protein